MSRWFRYYDEALDDPKVQRLSGDLFKVWVNLLSLASKNDGKLPSADDISFRLRISVQDAQQRVEDLILAGLIDVLPDKSFEPHNCPSVNLHLTAALCGCKSCARKSKAKTVVTSQVTSQ